MGRKRGSRLYQRFQGGAVRYYGDFRDFADVGGGREALVPDGVFLATSDERLAQVLVSKRLLQLEELRRCRVTESISFRGLRDYAQYHIALKKQSRTVTPQWLAAAKMHLDAACSFFIGHDSQRQGVGSLNTPRRGRGAVDRDLKTIKVEHVQAFILWLTTRPNRRGGCLSSSSQRKYLNSLSNLFRRAISERVVELGHNPAAALLEKPQEGYGRSESNWLEVPAAARLLAATLTQNSVQRSSTIAPMQLHAIVATMLLTGGRPSEVLGLEVRDISFERKTVCFRPNRTRSRLKTLQSERVVPLWPQLENILRGYVASLAESDGPLFPSPRTQGVLRDLRKAIDRACGVVGLASGSVRPYTFRHTFCAARLQTLDRGAPISVFTVARELGHGGSSLVNRVYGHLGTFRHRAEVVEYIV